jgi:hypothetical protein
MGFGDRSAALSDLAAGGRLPPPHAGHGLAMVDVRIRLFEQAIDTSAGGDDASGEPSACAYAVSVLIGSGAGDVFAGLQQSGVLLILFQHHLQGLQLDVVHPGGIVPASWWSRVLELLECLDSGSLRTCRTGSEVR